jgi:hypothetical protein
MVALTGDLPRCNDERRSRRGEGDQTGVGARFRSMETASMLPTGEQRQPA